MSLHEKGLIKFPICCTAFETWSVIKHLWATVVQYPLYSYESFPHIEPLYEQCKSQIYSTGGFLFNAVALVL